MRQAPQPKAGLSLWTIVLLGILFHAIYLYSIIHVYFQSPLVHGMRQYRAQSPPSNNSNSSTVHDNLTRNESSHAAKRVVFIVSDGLRADSLFELHKNFSDSFLHSLIRSKEASWGVSHTRVPTESRPCHVAMFAGFYEDVSAVTTGWKENPVHFDSVFNQSNYVLQIGSPDVVKIFKGDNMDSLYYEPEMEDFASADPTVLDKWVFDQLDNVFANNDTIKQRLKQHDNGVVIFLHLLGVDTSGHAYRPGTKGYLDNVIYVDQGVRNVTRAIHQFFGDNDTAFIFTADHGMSSKGAHGDGNPECTRTPFVAWGKGIEQGSAGSFNVIDDVRLSSEHENNLTRKQWNLDPNNRKDIRQADVAPLLTALLGLPYPVNNVGTLPLSYLRVSDELKTQHLFANALQILEQLKVKEEDKKHKTHFFFREYDSSHREKGMVDDISAMIQNKQYDRVQKKCHELITYSTNGLSYYQTYDWPVLMSIITVGYLSWIGFLLVQTMKHYGEFSYNEKKHTSQVWNVFVHISTVVLGASLHMFLYMQSSPLLYHCYLVFPILFVNSLCRNVGFISFYIRSQSKDMTTVIISCVMYLVALEVMMLGYFKRGVFSSCFIVLGIAPTLLGMSFHPRFGWILICICSSLFTLLPADYGSDTFLVISGGLLFIMLQVIWRRIYVHSPQKTTKGRYLFCLQLLLVFLSIYIVYDTEQSLSAREGLPRRNQIISWSISVISLFAPLFSPNFFKMRMQSVIMAFACPFILLSVNYEVLFYAALDVLMVLWARREVNARESNKASGNSSSRSLVQLRAINAVDYSTALLFIFFINVSFFGTGNLATIASFELKSVYRFITVFSPFLMTAILILKLMTPLLISTVSFSAVLRVTRTPQVAVFCIVVALFDIMTINFFFLVQDTGSWLEIGNSISRFAIGNIMIVLLSILFGISQMYTGTVQRWVNSVTEHTKNRKKSE